MQLENIKIKNKNRNSIFDGNRLQPYLKTTT